MRNSLVIHRMWQAQWSVKEREARRKDTSSADVFLGASLIGLLLSSRKRWGAIMDAYVLTSSLELVFYVQDLMTR